MNLKQKFTFVNDLLYLPPLVIILPALILGFILSKYYNLIAIASILLSLIIVDICANLLNNYKDWEIDKLNKKREMLHKILKKKQVLHYFLILFFILIAFLIMLATFFLAQINIYFIIMVFITFFLIIAYSSFLKLKDKYILNYVTLGLSYGVVPFLIGFFFGTNNLLKLIPFIPLLIFIFLTDFSYSISKDYPDIKGDRHFKKNTLPASLKNLRAFNIQFIMIGIAYAFLLFGVILRIFNSFYLLLFASFIIQILILNKTIKSYNVKNSRKMHFYTQLNESIIRLIILFIIFL
ncbi:MAG: UbiA family prenyltransferase [Candidatus Marsarchaeota archaeon]|nr:UbiA family prenyltransferase [Candidatus Marsarchaeota archaeon]MCL5106419.1 UbiA family prenyltransferase [Candidatus Marsarchaeota archaeon]